MLPGMALCHAMLGQPTDKGGSIGNCAVNLWWKGRAASARTPCPVLLCSLIFALCPALLLMWFAPCSVLPCSIAFDYGSPHETRQTIKWEQSDHFKMLPEYVGVVQQARH